MTPAGVGWHWGVWDPAGGTEDWGEFVTWNSPWHCLVLVLHGVTFLPTPSGEMNVNMKLILSVFGSLNTSGFLSNSDL